MPHKQEFSIFRQQVLSESAVILQDDSGIPYRFFTSTDWRVQLYGAYDHPYGSFRWLELPDLKESLRDPCPKATWIPNRLRILEGPFQPAAGRANGDERSEIAGDEIHA